MQDPSVRPPTTSVDTHGVSRVVPTDRDFVPAQVDPTPEQVAAADARNEKWARESAMATDGVAAQPADPELSDPGSNSGVAQALADNPPQDDPDVRTTESGAELSPADHEPGIDVPGEQPVDNGPGNAGESGDTQSSPSHAPDAEAPPSADGSYVSTPAPAE